LKRIMPKFGWCKFAEDKFGDRAKYHNTKFRMKSGVPLGIAVRRTIGKGPKCTAGAVTFRVRRGNGYYGSVADKIYQDKYNYPDVTGLENNAPDAAKTCFSNGVHAWQALSDLAKEKWNNLAGHGYKMSGYNLFLRDYMLSNY